LKREYPNFKYRFVCICFKDPVGFFWLYLEEMHEIFDFNEDIGSFFVNYFPNEMNFIFNEW
jgi:hypothetical protein